MDTELYEESASFAKKVEWEAVAYPEQYSYLSKSQATAEIFVRINDELNFLPLILVTDKAGAVKAEMELRSYGRDEFITQISTITIGKSSVRIVPRKNWDTEYYGLKPITIVW